MVRYIFRTTCLFATLFLLINTAASADDPSADEPIIAGVLDTPIGLNNATASQDTLREQLAVELTELKTLFRAELKRQSESGELTGLTL